MHLVRPLVCAVLLAVLAACAPGQPPLQFGPDGQPVQRVYRIAPGDTQRVRARALDSVNTLRAARGLAPLQENAQLIAAAERHSRDMAAQGRAWAFGSDGSSPFQRVARAGYRGEMRGQLVSETFESELETINAWMADRDERAILMDRQADEVGLAWHQESNGKLWWTLVTGRSDSGSPQMAFSTPASGPPIPLVPGVLQELGGRPGN